jgi:hypothetical protein
VRALDQFNNTATGYIGTVHFTTTSGGAGTTLPADTTLTNGTGTFSATLTTGGNQTITATDTGNSSITGTSGTIAVATAAATHLAIATPASATAGTAFSFTVTALDQFNNITTGYSGTVHFTSTDGASTLPANSTLTNGAGTFSATLVTAGSRTITAVDSVAPSITVTSNAIAVSAAAATHFAVSAPSTASSGTAFSFTVTALDPFNNTATGYAGSVHFTTTDAGSGVTLPSNSTLTAGTGTFSATLRTAGNQTITATDSVSAAVTGTSGAIALSNNTFSGPSATGTGTISASFTGGGATCAFSGPQFIGAPPGSSPVPPTVPGPNTRFPEGMFAFSLTGCTPGSTITMTITYPQSVAGATYFKYGPEASSPSPHWYVMPATVSGNTITFSITDGGQGDDDLTANGTIVDQGGPGFTSAQVPTLSQWMLALLVLAILGLGYSQVGRRRD